MRYSAKHLVAGTVGLFLTTTAASAEEVRVLSGEHEDFSRIVLIFETAVKWTKEPSNDGFRVSFDRSGLTMDLSEVYSKIPRERYSDVSFDPANSAFRVDTGCPCTLEVFEVRPGVIAMDLRESDEAALAAEATRETDSRSESDIGAKLGEALRTEAMTTASAGAWPLLAHNEEQPSVDAFRAALQRQLEMASNTGLVDRNASAEQGTHTPKTDDSTHTDGDDDHSEAGYRHPQVRVSDAFTPVGIPGAREASLDASRCGDFALDDLRLGPVEDPLRALSTARAGIVDFNGDIDQAGVFKLFETHLSLNQATEARRLLSEWPEAFSDIALAKALIDVLEGSSAPYLSQRMGCGAASAFWGLLASEKEQAIRARDMSQAESYFRTLSPYLQLALSDSFAERLSRKGAPDIAAAVDRHASLSAFAMGDVIPNGHGQTKPGKMGEAAGTTLANTGQQRENVPATVSKRLMDKIAGQGQIEPDLVELAQALSIETRGMPVSEDLAMAATLALLRNGQVDTAFDQFSRIVALLSPEDANAVQIGMAREILKIGDDAKFLSVIFTRRSWNWLSDLESGLHRSMRNRTLALGISSSVVDDLGLGLTSSPDLNEADAQAGDILSQEDEGSDVSPVSIVEDDAPRDPSTPEPIAVSAPTETTNPNETPAVLASATAGNQPTISPPSAVPSPQASSASRSLSEASSLSDSEMLLQRSKDSRRRINELLGRQGG